MGQKDLTSDGVIGAIGRAWESGTGAARKAHARALGRGQQCIADRANGKIGDDQEQDWLTTKGNPAIYKAEFELEQRKQAVADQDVQPLVNAFYQAQTERQLELLAEVRRIDEDKIRVDRTMAAMGIPRRPLPTVPEVSDPLVAEVRVRLARALAPRPTNREWRPTPRPQIPDYEPSISTIDLTAAR